MIRIVMLVQYLRRLSKWLDLNKGNLVLAASFLFLICNAIWKEIDADWRLYYVPLALLLVAFNFYVFKTTKGKIKIFFEYFLWLSYGNLIKMIFINNRIVSEANDYVFGVLMTLILIYKLWTMGNGSKSNNS